MALSIPFLTVLMAWMGMQSDTNNTTNNKMANNGNRASYTLRPLTRSFGAEAIGMDLSRADLHNASFTNQLKADLVHYRALLFRQQSLTGQRQVDISKVLGTIESTFYQHPKSPHPDIFRVSNHENEGCTQVGRSGWHIDGTFQMRPFMYQTMYFESVAEGGDTYFVPLKEFYQSLPPATQERYNRLWMVSNRRHKPVIHPLVYQHPFRPSQEPTMLFHCGEPFVKGWLEDEELPDDTQPSEEDKDGAVSNSRRQQQHMLPPRPLQEELSREIEARLDDIGLRMQWQPGDFLITDNLGLAHYASPGTQADWERVGLRILHRTTIVGGPETVPQKSDGRRSFV